jgi:hypothetical protein
MLFSFSFYITFLNKIELLFVRYKNNIINQLLRTNFLKMSAPIDCPICMETVVLDRNCVTTECGHCFHANCLMTSVAHNGFGCPYCRTAMAEVPDEDDSHDDIFNEYNRFRADYLDLEDTAMLRGFRFFWNNVNEVEHDPCDERVEILNQEDANGWHHDESYTMPNSAYVAEKLVERGITFEDLVKHILFYIHYGADNNEAPDYERRSSEVYGQFRIAITQYRRQVSD